MQTDLPIGANTVSRQQIIIEDLFPTLIAIAGADKYLPRNYVMDGVDTRHFLSEPGKTQIRSLVFHYPHVWGPHGPGYEPHSAMRQGDWKVVYFYNSRRWELYNLARDLGETHDLASTEPQRLQKLASELKQQLLSKQVQWPVNRVTARPASLQTPAEQLTLR